AVVYRTPEDRVVRTASELTAGDTVRLRWAPPGCESLEGCDQAEATITSVQPGPGVDAPIDRPLRRRGHRGEGEGRATRDRVRREVQRGGGPPGGGGPQARGRSAEPGGFPGGVRVGHPAGEEGRAAAPAGRAPGAGAARAPRRGSPGQLRAAGPRPGEGRVGSPCGR